MEYDTIRLNLTFSEDEFTFKFNIPRNSLKILFIEYFLNATHKYFLSLCKRVVTKHLQRGSPFLSSHTSQEYFDWVLTSIKRSYEDFDNLDKISNILLEEFFARNECLNSGNIRLIDFTGIEVLVDGIFDTFKWTMNVYQRFPRSHILPLGISVSKITAWKWIAYTYRNCNLNSNIFKNKLKLLRSSRSTQDARLDTGVWRYCHSKKEYNKYRDNQLKILNDFITIIGYVPSQEDMRFLHLHYPKILKQFLNTNISIRLFKHLVELERVEWFIREEGSWFKALVNCGILINAERKTNFGTWTVALDGHECRSIAERNVDDWLFKNGIPHDKEVKYPDSNFVADWRVKGFYLELFGLKGKESYDEKILLKRLAAKKANITLIELYLDDILRLDEKLGFLKK